jgi:molybdate transport system regulatory protein
MEVDFKLLLTTNEEVVISKGKYRLLKRVGEKGSLNAAAKSMGLSYKKAFLYIKKIEEILGEKVLIRTPGKASVLSLKGIEIIEMYDFFYKELRKFTEEKLNEYNQTKK